MNRLAVIVVAAALLTGSVPVAATLAIQTPSDGVPAPGASFAGVVGVQQAEVGNEVAHRALERRLDAANTDAATAAVVASETNQLEQRLDELEREKARLERAYENGSIDRGQYRARLARLGAEINSVEMRADRTADAAAGVSEEALREKGVNVSEVRSVAQRANETGGGEVAEATASVGNGVGNGLTDAPGKSGDRGRSNGTPGTNGTDATAQPGGPPATGKPTDVGNGQGAGNETGVPNGSDVPNGSQPTDVKNRSDQVGNGTPGGPGNGTATDGNETVTPTATENETVTPTATENVTTTTTTNETETTMTPSPTETDMFGAVLVR